MIGAGWKLQWKIFDKVLKKLHQTNYKNETNRMYTKYLIILKTILNRFNIMAFIIALSPNKTFSNASHVTNLRLPQNDERKKNSRLVLH